MSFQIYNLFLSAAARALEDSSEPLSWARAMQEGMNAIMRCELMTRKYKKTWQFELLY